jgi:hypothetical protein
MLSSTRHRQSPAEKKYTTNKMQPKTKQYNDKNSKNSTASGINLAIMATRETKGVYPMRRRIRKETTGM